MPAQKRKNVILNERGASSWDLVLKILSITLVSLFAFSSGVWFGKKLSDSDHQRMALEGEFDKEVRKTASTEVRDSGIDDKEALTDEEVSAAADKALEAQKAKAEVAEKTEAVPAHGEKAANKMADAHGAAPAEATGGHEVANVSNGHGEATEPKISTKPAAKVAAAHEGHDAHAAAEVKSEKATTRSVASTASVKPDLSAVHQAAVRVANNASPTEKEKPQAESRVPSSLPKTVGAANDVEFTVQVASYPTADAAKQHVEAMVKKGFPAFPVEAKINGKTWYRVSVGSFKSFNDASKFRAQLLKQAELPSAIVQKVTR
jgi:cell division protein FtsN